MNQPVVLSVNLYSSGYKLSHFQPPPAPMPSIPLMFTTPGPGIVCKSSSLSGGTWSCWKHLKTWPFQQNVCGTSSLVQDPPKATSLLLQPIFPRWKSSYYFGKFRLWKNEQLYVLFMHKSAGILGNQTNTYKGNPKKRRTREKTGNPQKQSAQGIRRDGNEEEQPLKNENWK